MGKARVLLVASEAVPLMKTGGLADVISALAAELVERHVDATVLMPAYPAALAAADALRPLGPLLEDLPGGGPGRLLLGTMPGSGVPVLLLETARFAVRSGNPYVDADGNEYPDNALAFGDLAHAAARICAGETVFPAPHVLHANDWHAGLAPLLLRAQGITGVGSALTIHNLAFQGNMAMDTADALGVPHAMRGADGAEFWGKLSFLKAGVAYADRITTVSDTYAREILTPQFGYGFEGMLNARRDALVAIANGVDTATWNPASDALIARTFHVDDMSGKSSCKRELQKLSGLPVEPFAPLIALGSRITHQKMADVALAALPRLLNIHPRAQIVVLGRGDQAYEAAFRELAAAHPDRVAVHMGYSEKLAHALHAGADMLLHGSRFEPYGLTPIYSMLYGTIPVASRVGGLCDTVVDAGDGDAPADSASGVLFDGDDADDMVIALERALQLYSQGAHWQRMQRNAMRPDFSWSGPALKYLRMYEEIAPEAARPLFANSLMPRAKEADLAAQALRARA
ncbi:glycogen synthase GlgA [Noviherbaspirillum pedocola]|uniref:Glycogen synthase n=1 Tax=Noviherbaspirillum pedocola TaxID=2801341 RepID=A0A934T3V5_9BURK|nr:glycogen synthase GlgA [Noviherbaspirillum pedocola]MBK4738233.1 glycogen synthase GlgA [Noviherbaspirillum pedocola]